MKGWIIVIPVGLYLVIVFGVLVAARKLRKTRWPFKEEDRLLRGPGESLRKEVMRIDESFFSELFGGIIAILLGTAATLYVVTMLKLTLHAGWLLVAVVALFTAAISAIRICRLWKRRQGYHLGWFGERIVAEKLAPLRFSGWRVFHDVPFVSNGKTFNIDHVVVGECGLFAIETKTRRKGGTRGPESDDVVYFDGHALHWPRYKDDNQSLEQAEANAVTLTKWIYDEIGERVPAHPILVIPGWSLKLTCTGPHRQCRVDSANWIQNTFKDLKPCLSAKTVELVTRRLLSKCRDVED
jgi:hypothetical protein